MRDITILAECDTVFERVHQIARRQLFTQDTLDPSAHFFCGARRVSVQAQLAHILVQASYGRHGCGSQGRVPDDDLSIGEKQET